jgi:hypothetical protein
MHAGHSTVLYPPIETKLINFQVEFYPLTLVRKKKGILSLNLT